MKMSRVPLRWTAKSWSWCMGRQSRLASAPSTMVVAVTSWTRGASSWPARTRSTVRRVARTSAPLMPALLTRRRSCRRPAVAEAGVGLDTDHLVALVAVLDVDHPEPAGAQASRLLLAHRTQDLAARDLVARTHRVVEDDRVLGDHCFRQAEALLEVEVHLQGEHLLGATGGPVMRSEPHRQHGGRGDRS